MLDMQAMKKNFLLTILVLLLAGCVSSGFGSPWDSSDYNRPAQQAPKPLSNTSQNENQSATYQEAGLEFYAEDKSAQENNTTQTHQKTTFNSERNSSYSAQRPVTQQQYMRAVQVGFLVPLSGEHADIGQALLQAAQMAIFDLGYDSFVLLPRDTRGTPEGAKMAMDSALKAGAELIIGPLFSSSVRAIKSSASRNNVNVLSFSTDWSQAGQNTFIMGFLPFAQVQRVTQFALAQGIEKIAVLAPNSDYGNAVIASYHSLTYRLGLPTAEVVRFPVDDSDISAIIREFTKYDERVEALNEEIKIREEILEQNPLDKIAEAELEELEKLDTYGDLPFDAVLLPVGGDKARAIANLLSYYDLDTKNVKRLGTGLWDDKGLSAEQSLNGAWYAAPSPELRADFERRYRNLYGQRPPRLSTLAYDATALAAVLARNGYKSTGRPAFDRNSILNPNGFAGLDGVFRFRPDGLIERGLAIMEIKDKNIIEIDEAPKTFQMPAQREEKRAFR
jgi:ABC-type branched-subunit amino acid transport system substrate-binding protein